MSPKSAANQPLPMVSQKAAAAISVGIAVTLARYFLVTQYGADVPFADQWVYEFKEVYQPYLHGTLQFKDFFTPFGEHIQMFLKLVAFVLFYLAGIWNVLLILKFQTVFSSVTAGVFAYLLPEEREVRWLGCLSLFLFFSGVIGFFNLLIGGQFIFPLSVLFTCGACWLVSDADLDVRKASAVGALCGLSLLNFANGIFTSLICAAIIGLAAMRKRDRVLGVIAALVGVFAITALVSAPKDPWGLAARSAGHFFSYLVVFFRWPDWPFPYSGLLLWAVPVLAAVWRTPAAGRRIRFAFLLYGWVALNGVAVAYGRAGYTTLPHRYFDILLGAWTAALFVLSSMPRRIAINGTILLAVWALALNVHYLPNLKRHAASHREMRQIEQSAIALEALRPGAGLQYFAEHRQIVDAMNELGYAGLWRLVNDPDTRRIRPAVFPSDFLRAVLCANSDWTAIPVTSLAFQNATSAARGDEALMNATTGNPQVTIPEINGSIRAVRIVLTPPAPTPIEVFIYLGGVLANAGHPYSEALKAGRNSVELYIGEYDVKRLRIDPGALPGPYIIHKIEVKTCALR